MIQAKSNTNKLYKIERIELEPFEIDICKTVGNARHEYGVNNSIPTNAASYEFNFRGCLGEYAVSKFLGVLWPFSVGNIDKNDLPGLRHPLDIKTTSGKNHYKCLVPDFGTEHRQRYIDNNFIFVFCNYYDSGVDIWGFIPADRYFSKPFASIDNNMKYPGWCMHKNKLYAYNKKDVLNFLKTS
jgi:hypothetical protein